MENYEQKLLALQPQVLLGVPQVSIPYGALLKYLYVKDAVVFEAALRKLAKKLPFKIGTWPSFNRYTEYGYMVELNEFKCNLLYCERGTYNLHKKCDHVMDLAFEILRILMPGYTRSASAIAASLDAIADQRLLIWLRMSSEIFHMYQVNSYFGFRMAACNVMWMCEELVRMEVFKNVPDAFESEKHILKGLMLSGMSDEMAKSILYEIERD